MMQLRLLAYKRGARNPQLLISLWLGKGQAHLWSQRR